MKVGAHVSSAAPIAECVDRALAIGADAVQIFASSPRAWRPGGHDAAALRALRERAAERGVEPLFLHGVYLVNLAAADADLRERSVASLIDYLEVGATVGAAGTIFHVGSHRGEGFDAALPRVVEAIGRVLAATPSETRLILENSAGQGGTVGGAFEELGAIVRAVDSPRLGVCLDTCHAFAAGYDLRTPAAVAATFAALDATVGLDRLAALHANDSKAGLGSRLDRHQNIGAGAIGLDGFRALTAHPVVRGLPLILEVPGFEGGGPDRRNVELLRALAAEADAPAG